MKIIAVGMNYALHNKELGHTHENKEPVIFLKPDSAILKDGKPFFIPDFSNEVHYETEVVVRICRLGKNIAPRFAHRYYDAVTVGIDFTARDLQRKFREAGNPWELCKGFDNSAAIGTFVPLEQVGGNVQNLDFHLTIDDKEYFEECVGKIVKTRENAKERLSQLGFSFPDSKANFIFATHKSVPAKEIFEKLKEKNIFVRYFNQPLIDNYLRISIGTDEQMEKLYAALEEITGQVK